jgi:hypothetical protein
VSFPSQSIASLQKCKESVTHPGNGINIPKNRNTARAQYCGDLSNFRNVESDAFKHFRTGENIIDIPLHVNRGIVHNNNAVIIVEAGERPEEIDFERAEEAKKRAEERLRGGEGIDKNRAEQALYRSIARLELYKDK